MTPSRDELVDGWEAAGTVPDACPDPAGLGDLSWIPARVPGTAAGALRDADLARPEDLDAQDWWFRIHFDAEPAAAGEEVRLRLDGLATVADVHLNGARVLESESMFAGQAVDVGALLRGGEPNELAIRFRALSPLLAQRRRPRARWRTRLVAQANVRFFRTALLGRAPGFAPGPAPVGPWRPVWLERRRGIAVDELELRPRIEGEEGVLAARVALRSLDPGRTPAAVELELRGPSGGHRAALEVSGDGGELTARGELRVPAVARWWPHTHGEPILHEVRALVDGEPAAGARRVGFRELDFGSEDTLRDGLDIRVNGARVFVRGAVWTPVDPVGLAPARAELRSTLERARDAGMNMVRVPGIGSYESDDFHDLCDELGLLVWQDFMFANLDYPTGEEGFAALVEGEARAQLARLGDRPSLAVLCGNSEIEQQVAMLGLDPQLGRGTWFGETLPRLVGEAGVDAAYVPSAPCGGTLPFRPDRGVANYYGVGAYLRPLEDARRAGVRFAAECLAFANVPGEEVVESLLPHAPADVVAHHPRWKAGVPRDAGAGWDFEDVRDHYLELLFGVNARELRSVDHERYLELSRATSGEVMAEVFGEWRRCASTCGGGLVLWLRDLVAGAGWGVLDHRGEPKVAYHHLRRALAPVAVWTTDEGLGGVAVHVANDRAEPLVASLRVALYRDFETRVEQAGEAIELAAHSGATRDVEALLGRFVDAACAYGFGPPGHDLIVASLERGDELLSQAVRFPAGRPGAAETAARLGLEAACGAAADGAVEVTVRSRRLAYGVRLHVPGFDAADDAFCVEPGGVRRVTLRAREPGAELAAASLTALNLRGSVRIA